MEGYLAWGYPLKVFLPSLFALAPSKEAWVREYWSSATSGKGWNLIFSRPFNDWEVKEAERLLCGLGRYTPEEEAANEVRWKLTNARVFTVKSMYKALQMSAVQPLPWQMVWRSCVQPKMSFFT